MGTSSSIGQSVVVRATLADGGGGGGGTGTATGMTTGPGEIITSGSPACSQSNLHNMLSGWSPDPVNQSYIY